MRRLTSKPSLQNRIVIVVLCLISLSQLASCKTVLSSKGKVNIHSNVYLNQMLVVNESEICYSAKLSNQNEFVIDKVLRSGNPFNFLQALPLNECRFVVCQFQWKGSNVVGLFFWKPLRAISQEQVNFSESIDYVRKNIRDYDFAAVVNNLGQLSPSGLALFLKNY